MVPLVGNICTIGTNLITHGTIGKEIVQMVKMVMPLVPMVQMLPTNGTIERTPNTRHVVEKTGRRGFRPGATQIGMCSY